MSRTAPDFGLLRVLVTCGAIAAFAAAAGLAGCGGDSGNDDRNAGTGGTTATGGTGTTPSTTGGSSATTGGTTSSSTGGTSSSTTSLDCSDAAALKPANESITDFSDYQSSAGVWGPSGGLQGRIFGYKGGDSTESALVDSGALRFTATVTVGQYAGAGLAFNKCVDASAYTGFQFTVSGDAGACELQFQVQTYSQQAKENGGGCDTTAGDCYAFPAASISGTSDDPVTVKFADLSHPFTGTELVGLQWQANSAASAMDACVVDLKIDDIKFTTD